MSDKRKARDLTLRERMFCAEYVFREGHGEGDEAAIAAGYSAKSAKNIACQLLHKPHVKERINELLAAREKRTLVNADYVVTALREVVERCLSREPVMVREGRKLVQATETIPCDCSDANCKGTSTVGVWQFDSAGANGALGLLGRHLRMFAPEAAARGTLMIPGKGGAAPATFTLEMTH